MSVSASNGSSANEELRHRAGVAFQGARNRACGIEGDWQISEETASQWTADPQYGQDVCAGAVCRHEALWESASFSNSLAPVANVEEIWQASLETWQYHAESQEHPPWPSEGQANVSSVFSGDTGAEQDSFWQNAEQSQEVAPITLAAEECWQHWPEQGLDVMHGDMSHGLQSHWTEQDTWQLQQLAPEDLTSWSCTSHGEAQLVEACVNSGRNDMWQAPDIQTGETSHMDGTWQLSEGLPPIPPWVMIPPAVGDFTPEVQEKSQPTNPIPATMNASTMGLDEPWGLLHNGMTFPCGVQINTQAAEEILNGLPRSTPAAIADQGGSMGPPGVSDAWRVDQMRNASQDLGFPTPPLGTVGTDWAWQGHQKTPEDGHPELTHRGAYPPGHPFKGV
jgi:hypothetical protein